MNAPDRAAFQKTVQAYYAQHGRHNLPWRQPETDGRFDPYKILVSELMLQQTQVARVVPKFQLFIGRYPAFTGLARAPLAEVLTLWNGLGYNRRARFLWLSARAVIERHHGQLPPALGALKALPGIGPGTAGAILVYAFNQPAVFVETNIRTVFIHHFFGDEQGVADDTIVPLVQETMPEAAVREWYWALMDYGTYLKQTVGNVSRASAAYAKQSRFPGSRRQVRGAVLRQLVWASLTVAELQRRVHDKRLMSVLADLEQEGFITQKNNRYRLGT